MLDIELGGRSTTGHRVKTKIERAAGVGTWKQFLFSAEPSRSKMKVLETQESSSNASEKVLLMINYYYSNFSACNYGETEVKILVPKNFVMKGMSNKLTLFLDNCEIFIFKKCFVTKL